MTGAKPQAKRWTKCADCPQEIPVFGGRKRCLECQDKIIKLRLKRKHSKGTIHAT
jgi:hypothetical protein